MALAIIGGTGIDELAGISAGIVRKVKTRWGEADVVEAEVNGKRTLFLPRHGLDHSLLPGQINYRAQIAALKSLGAQHVIGICAVGSLIADIPAGSFAILTDFIDMTRHRKNTFFDEPDSPIVHTDFTYPYCPQMTDMLIDACKVSGVKFSDSATYVGVDGPRYETPAEIRLYASWGAHVIGMTNTPEAILAKEAGLCYGALAVVSNLAAGLSTTPLSHDEVRAAVVSCEKQLKDILARAIENIPKEQSCDCGDNQQLVI